jgi:hypothetical protein
MALRLCRPGPHPARRAAPRGSAAQGLLATVATTWSLSFERIERQSAAAAALLRLCAFLAPDDIPLSLVRAAAGELAGEAGAELADGIKLERAVASLRRYALAGRLGDGLRVHRLVQLVLRSRLPRTMIGSRRMQISAGV